MNPKGPSLVDLDTTEPAPTRRGLIAAAGAAGLVGAAVIAGGSRAAAAPTKPTPADSAALVQAMRLETAAQDLYEVAAARLSGDDAVLATVIGNNHKAYAQSIAGATGVSNDQRSDEVYDSLRAAFDTSDPQAFANSARQLENTAVATHTALLGGCESSSAIELTASIITTEARHAAVLTSLAGFAANLDQMLVNDAVPLALGGTA